MIGKFPMSGVTLEAIAQQKSTWILKWPKQISSPVLTLLVAAYFVSFLNKGFFTQVLAAHAGSGVHFVLFFISVVLFAVLIVNGFLTLFASRYIFKPLIVVLLLAGSAASYFIDHFQVIFNREMVQNILETDQHEAVETISFGLVGYVLLTGVLPSFLLIMTPVKYGSRLRESLGKLVILLGTLASIGVIALLFYQDYASLFRNNRQLRHELVPTGFTYSLLSYGLDQLRTPHNALEQIGLDAHVGVKGVAVSGRKAVVIMVVGETARAENFSLNGYERETNPELKQEDIIYFNNVHSCGTSTAVSVPCMFAQSGRKSFDGGEARYQENLLDVIKHAGLDVLWRDNNSGCKGVCSRVDFEDMSHAAIEATCNDEECFDMVLLNDLAQRIDAYPNNVLVVLHQKGSHGPAYYLRTPKEFQKFAPFCHTNQLQQCSRAEIVNAYDNTLLYTDHMLAQMIEFLKQHADRYDSSLLYVSDHGESLSESHLYLHGIPYAVAPDQQIHVPMLMWLSDQYAERMQIDTNCLKLRAGEPYSHDNLFDTVLDMLDVQTAAKREERSIITPCERG